MNSLPKTNKGPWLILLTLSLLAVEFTLYHQISFGRVPVSFCQSIEVVPNPRLDSLSEFSTVVHRMIVIGIIMGLAWLFLFARSFAGLLSQPQIRPTRNNWFIWATHITAFLVISFFRANQRGACFNNIDPNQPLLLAGFFISALILIVTFLLILAPLGYWISYFRKYLRRLVVAFLIVMGLTFSLKDLYSLIWIEQQYNDVLFAWTAYLVNGMLDQLGFTLSINTAKHLMTVNDFSIEVAGSCLGYQGMTIILTVLTLYFIIYRNNYRFPNALLIYPIVIVFLFLANCVRFVLLLMIGAKISPDIALAGFHSVAGWLNLVLILGLSILLVNRLPFFAVNATGFTLDLSNDKIRLAPEVLLILVSLVSLLVTAKFEWVYPLRVLIVGAVVWRWWPRLGLVFSNQWVVPVIVGVIVFMLWLAMVPVDATRSTEFYQTLTSVPVWLMLLWIVFRMLGAVVVVPLAEELAFRGYLFDASGRLLKQYLPSSFNSNSEKTNNVHSGWLQTVLILAVTSIGFGILHSAWLAGILAGLAFGLVRLYRNNLMDAVIAHGVTNLLLAVYILSAGAWSLW